MEAQIIEPNPILIEYFQLTNILAQNLNTDLTDFIQDDEWHYVQANIENNILLLKRLEEVNLLPTNVNLCDCGIGLGTVMFDLYLQSKDIKDKTFTFTGIEKYDRYVNTLNNQLDKYWENNLNIIHDDIMNENYSNYNFIYLYTPFRIDTKLMNFFQKVITEMPEGGIVIGIDQFRIENYGDQNLINDFRKLKQHIVDDLVIYQK
jgi:hypothetical protein